MMTDATAVESLFQANLLTLEGIGLAVINSEILRGEVYFKAECKSLPVSLLSTFTSTSNTPDFIQNIVAHLAASFIGEDNNTEFAAKRRATADADIKKLNRGSIRLYDKATGAEIPISPNSVSCTSTRASGTATDDDREFTMSEMDDSRDDIHQ